MDTDAKVIRTAAGDLPLSPVMDRTFWEARTRYEQPKPPSGPAANAFERAFRKNPFGKREGEMARTHAVVAPGAAANRDTAIALATPIRADSITKCPVPAFFLQGFNLVAHPETGTPWWVPQKLIADESPATTDGPSGDEVPVEDIQPREEAERVGNRGPGDVPRSAAGPPSKRPAESPRPQTATEINPSPRFSAGYLFARQDLLDSAMEKASGLGKMHEQILGASSGPVREVARKSVWREDMSSYVLDQMRHQIVQDILYLSRLCETAERYYIVKCFGWNDVRFKQRGAVLWFENPPAEGDGVKDQGPPGPVATMDIEIENGAATTSILVHNMPMLLGDEYAKKLRDEAGVLQDGSIFMLAGRRTTELQMKLWKLQGFLYYKR